MQLPPSAAPGPFSLSDGARLRQLLEQAPLDVVAVEELDVPLHAPSFDDWWTRTTALAGPLAQILKTLPEDAIRERARAHVDAYSGPDGLVMPGVTLIASARG